MGLPRLRGAVVGAAARRTSRPTWSTSTERVTGTIGLKLFKGSVRVVTRESPNAVYDAQLATFAESGGLFSQHASPGFIELWSLQSALAHRLRHAELGASFQARGDPATWFPRLGPPRWRQSPAPAPAPPRDRHGAEDPQPVPTPARASTSPIRRRPAARRSPSGAVRAPQGRRTRRAGGFCATRRTPADVLTANIEVANLDERLRRASSVWLYFAVGDVLIRRRSPRRRRGWSYRYGTRRAVADRGGTRPAAVRGRNGIVPIVVPAALGLDGKTIRLVRRRRHPGAADRLRRRSPARGRRRPDATAGKTFVVEAVLGDGHADAGRHDPAAGGTTPPPAACPDAPPARRRSTSRCSCGKLSARKLRQERAFKVKLQAGERMTRLDGPAAEGHARRSARGKLAAAGPGAATLKVKDARAELKKGTYRLAFTAHQGRRAHRVRRGRRPVAK